MRESEGQEMVHMLSNTKQVYAKMEGSSSVSSKIDTSTHGSFGSFTLVEDDSLYEFAYSTNMYRCTPSDSIYSKITKVYPKYVVINCTASTLLFSQESMIDRSCPLTVKSG